MARKDFDKEFYKILDELTGTTDNSDRYRKMFGKMSDKQLRDYLEKCETGERRITITAPNYTKIKLSTEKNIKIAKKIGLEFYQRLVFKSDNPEVPDFTTPNKFMVVKVMIGRVSQFISNSNKLPKDLDHTDTITNQARGPSEGISMTKDELSILTGIGLDKALTEIFKVGGGDTGAFNALRASYNAKGEAKLSEILPYSTGVGSKELTSVLLKGMHIEMTL